MKYNGRPREVVILGGVTSIGERAFSGLGRLTSVQIPEGVASIGKRVFYRREKLAKIQLPASLADVDGRAFDDCHKLTNIAVAKGNPVFIPKNGVLYSKDMKTLVRFPEGKISKSYAIPDGVISIGAGAFHRCKGLTSVELSASLTSIGDEAFGSCESMASIQYSRQRDPYYKRCVCPLHDPPCRRNS